MQSKWNLTSNYTDHSQPQRHGKHEPNEDLLAKILKMFCIEIELSWKVYLSRIDNFYLKKFFFLKLDLWLYEETLIYCA